MYAELNENDELVDDAPVKIWYRSGTFQYVEDGLTFTAPRDWMTAWTIEQKHVAHIFVMTTNESNFDSDRQHVSGDAPTYTFDGTTVDQTFTFVDNVEPASLNRYKEKNKLIVDNEEQIRINLAEDTPQVGIDFTEDANAKKRANMKRDNKAKKKVNAISDADDHLFDHIDQLDDAAIEFRKDIDDALDYDAIDVIVAAMPTDPSWPIWSPIA